MNVERQDKGWGEEGGGGCLGTQRAWLDCFSPPPPAEGGLALACGFLLLLGTDHPPSTQPENVSMTGHRPATLRQC